MTTTSRSVMRWAAAAAVPALVALALSGCTEAEAVADKPQPATVETAGGAARITLTPKAVQRLGITTAPASVAAGGVQVPLDAVLYASDGSTFLYTSPADRTYVKARVTIARITGEVATLTAGPPAGTPVVTVGGSELYGVETGLGSK